VQSISARQTLLSQVVADFVLRKGSLAHSTGPVYLDFQRKASHWGELMMSVSDQMTQMEWRQDFESESDRECVGDCPFRESNQVQLLEALCFGKWVLCYRELS